MKRRFKTLLKSRGCGQCHRYDKAGMVTFLSCALLMGILLVIIFPVWFLVMAEIALICAISYILICCR